MNTAKQAAISERVLELVASGMNVIDALKEVCGAENVDAMIEDLFNSLRK